MSLMCGIHICMYTLPLHFASNFDLMMILMCNDNKDIIIIIVVVVTILPLPG